MVQNLGTVALIGEFLRGYGLQTYRYSIEI
jgi:hypothetical protein